MRTCRVVLSNELEIIRDQQMKDKMDREFFNFKRESSDKNDNEASEPMKSKSEMLALLLHSLEVITTESISQWKAPSIPPVGGYGSKI